MESEKPPVNFFRTAFSENTFAGVANEAGQIKVYVVDLSNGQTRQISTSNPGVEIIRTSGRYVVWDRNSSDIFAYDLLLDKEVHIAPGIYPDVFDNVVVWVDTRDFKSNSADIYGYDLELGKEFSIVTGPGRQTQPKISGQWVAYLHIVKDGDYHLRIHHIQTGEDLEIGTVPVFVPPSSLVAAEYFAISGNRLAWISAQDFQTIHVYDLDARTDRVLPNPVPKEKSHPSRLMLDGDILIYADDQWIGYDLSQDVAFSISLLPSDEWQGAGVSLPHLSNGRLVWILGSQLFTAQIVRGK